MFFLCQSLPCTDFTRIQRVARGSRDDFTDTVAWYDGGGGVGVAEVAAAIVVACGVTAARELRGSALAAVRATAAARMKGLAADDE